MSRSALAIWLFFSFFNAGGSVQLGSQQQPLTASNREGTPFHQKFDDFVTATLSEWHVPGLSIAVIDNGHIYSKGYGLAILPDQNATADTQYMTGSTTKAFTAAAAGLLVHDPSYPNVKWTSPIQDFIREDFALEDDHATAHTTIEDALSHRTGLPRHDFIAGMLDDTTSSLVRRMRFLPMTAEPRTLWQYCNLMYAVMTDVLETITGQDLATIFAENLWKPLGMSSTTFDPSSTSRSGANRLARGYYWNPAKADCLESNCQGEYIAEPYDDVSYEPGAGAIYSTVNDYALWIKAFLDAADSSKQTNHSSPISSALFHDLLTPRTIMTWDEEDQDPSYSFITPALYALGWFSVQIGGERIVIHDGSVTGFGANIYMLPERGYAIVTMANTEGTSNVAGNAVAAMLLREKLNTAGVKEAAISTVQETVARMSDLSSRRSRRKGKFRGQQRPLASTWVTMQSGKSKPLPLPGTIHDYVGLYTHPAYGTINLTVSKADTSEKTDTLGFLLYPRDITLKVRFKHITNTVFEMESAFPHGLGDVVTGEDIVWEDVSGGEKAAFSLGLDGCVDEMGIEIEAEMIEMAAAKGERYWKDGMIWFKKV